MAANPQANSQYETNKLPGFTRRGRLMVSPDITLILSGSFLLLLHVATFSRMDGLCIKLTMGMISVALTTLEATQHSRHSIDYVFTVYTMSCLTMYCPIQGSTEHYAQQHGFQKVSRLATWSEERAIYRCRRTMWPSLLIYGQSLMSRR